MGVGFVELVLGDSIVEVGCFFFVVFFIFCLCLFVIVGLFCFLMVDCFFDFFFRDELLKLLYCEDFDCVIVVIYLE